MLEALERSKSKDVLAYICTEQAVRFSELERELGLNASVVNRSLDGLVEAGAVEKQKGRYELTTHGRALAAMYNHVDGSACSRHCSPAICVGPLLAAESAVASAADGPAHGLLESLPMSVTEVEASDASPDVVTMLEHWGLVTTHHDEYHRTVQGDNVLDLLDALGD